MATRTSIPNEVLLLEARLSQQKTQTHPNLSDDEYFLISAVDTVLRQRGLSHRQIEAGIVEGGNDGGIDAVYLFQDGLLVEDETHASGSERPQLELEIIQAKNQRGFGETPVQQLIDHLPLLLQLDMPRELTIEFNERVLDRFRLFSRTFIGISSRFPELMVRIHYVTKAVEPPNDKVRRKSERLKSRVVDCFRDATVAIELVGAQELNNKARERLSSVLDMAMSEGPISAQKGGLVCLVSLAEYARFITADDGRLRDEIFEENVRDYEGATIINREIGASLKQGDISTADFWWLNNGVTILGRRVQATNKQLTIEDPQIVNGLQTSRNVYHYFNTLGRIGEPEEAEGKARHLLVRVIQAEDETLAAQIIKATNSQNRVSIASLRATDPFQRSIEDYFLRHGLFYERKKNQYKNQGKPRTSIIEVLELAQAVASIVLCEPHTARGRPSALVRDPLYNRVFSHKTPLPSYWNCVQVMRKVDEFLESRSDISDRRERSNYRFHLARASCAFALASSRPRPAAIQHLNVLGFSAENLQPVFEWVLEAKEAAESATGVHDLNVLGKGQEWSAEMDRRLSRYTDKTRWPKRLTSGWDITP